MSPGGPYDRPGHGNGPVGVAHLRTEVLGEVPERRVEHLVELRRRRLERMTLTPGLGLRINMKPNREPCTNAGVYIPSGRTWNLICVCSHSSTMSPIVFSAFGSQR